MAKATKHPTTRRRLSAEHMALIADMRRMVAAHHAAVVREMNLECSREDRAGWRKYNDAIGASEAAYERASIRHQR